MPDDKPPNPSRQSASPLDTRPDGIETALINPLGKFGSQTPEFPLSTRVLFVNGINSNDAESQREARAFANVIHQPVELVHLATHGIGSDFMAAVGETVDQHAAFAGPAERGIAHEVLSLAASGKDVHIMAYSRGALVAERGLEFAQKELQGRGVSPQRQAEIFSHVTLETVNGASHNVPDGVRAVHYVREGDVLVSQALGMGPLAPLSRAVIAGAMAVNGVTVLTDAAARDGIFNHPNGPVIEIPPLDSRNPITQHLFEPMLPARQPFAKAYAPYEREQQEHPQPAPGSSPLEHGLRQASETHPHVSEPSPRPAHELHIFVDGQTRTVGEGHHQSGKIYNHGPLIAMTHEHASHSGSTMYSRHELLEHTPPEHRAALGAALHDGNTLEVRLGKHGVAVHDVTPKHALAPSLEKHRAVAPDRSDGLSR